MRSRPTQPNAKHRQAEPYHTTDTKRSSEDMLRPPPGEARDKEELVDSQERTASRWGGEGGKGGRGG